MPKQFDLIVDHFSLVRPELEPYADQVFSDIANIELKQRSVVVFSRATFRNHTNRILSLCDRSDVTVVFENAAEGSITLMDQIREYGIEDRVLAGKILVIGGGDMYYVYPYLDYDYFISVFTGYQENIQQMPLCEEIYHKPNKPYDFLFLNGRARPHRKYLWHRLDQLNLLNRSLWTMLDGKPSGQTLLTLIENNQDLMKLPTPLQRLPKRYEVEQYRNIEFNTPTDRMNIKPLMFNHTWGDVYLQAEPYIDSYFSLVTETVADRPWSFRTEKIVKPLAAGHPWICVSGPGFYRDLRNLGFKTFDHVIDESFDSIDNQQDRLDRIVEIVRDLCSQDLDDFLKTCYSTCKYNQQHLLEVSAQVKAELPQRFFNFIQTHSE